MKRLWGILSIIAAVLVLSSASSVSWEGRAVLGDGNDFPGPGKYAKSRMFSKGEMVEVYNPANETRTTVVITGSSDTAGVLIMLSPEAAADLAITEGYDAIVRVNKKLLYSEPSIISSGTKAAETAAAPAAETRKGPESTAPADFKRSRSEVLSPLAASGTASAAEKDPADSAELVATPLLPTKTLSDTAAVPAAPAPEEVPTAVETARSEPGTASGVLPEPEPVVVAKAENVPASEPVTEPVQEHTGTLMSAEPSETEAAASEPEETPENVEGVPASPEEPIYPEHPAVIAASEVPETVSESSEMPAEPAAIEEVEPLSTYTLTANTDDSESAVPADTVAAPNADSETLSTDAAASIAASDTAVPAPIAESETAGTYGTDEDFILIPSSMLPPENSLKSASAAASSTETPSVPAPAETPRAQAPEIAALIIPAQLPDDLLVYGISDFEKGKFYVQLATMKDVENVRLVVNTYGKKYPVRIQTAAPGAGFRVFIGPLTKDEYGAVLERFKRTGFTDAFVKKM